MSTATNTSTRRRAARTRPSAADTDAFVQAQLGPFMEMVAQTPECLEDDGIMAEGFGIIERVCGDGESAKAALMRRLATCLQQNGEMLGVLKSLREQKPTAAWILSPEFAFGSNGQSQRLVFAAPLGRDNAAPECYAVVDPPTDGQATAAGEPLFGAPSPPFLGLVDATNGLYFGPAVGLPRPPLRAELFEVVASHPQTRFADLGEIEVSDGVGERNFTLLAQSALAQEIKTKMDEDGESVHVRSESGVATGIHKSEDGKHEDWLEFPPIDGPSVHDLIHPIWLRQQWDRDIRHIAAGRPVRVILIGPTGTGKTTGAERVGRDGVRAAERNGNPKKGFVVIRVSSSHVGSSFIHQTERNIFRAFRKAKSLAKKGYVVVILCDEADALLGEMRGGEHTHNRSERLAVQSLLTDPMENVAIYLTMNARRNSWLPAAIDRKFFKRVYGQATRGQTEAVAAHYAAQYPPALETLGMSADEFAAALADDLYSDHRVVATVRLYSGKTLAVRARDLHNCSPGKVKDLIDVFCFDVADGLADSMDPLRIMIDREFRSPNLTADNLRELTFIAPPHDDAVRDIELAR